MKIDSPNWKPLALMLGEALEAPTHEARFRGLQRLGDVSLFIAGFFAQGFARKLVDITYDKMPAFIEERKKAYLAAAKLLGLAK